VGNALYFAEEQSNNVEPAERCSESQASISKHSLVRCEQYLRRFLPHLSGDILYKVDVIFPDSTKQAIAVMSAKGWGLK
jgi:hypothetical protein